MAVFAVRNRVTRAGGALLMLSCFRRAPEAARRSAAGNPAGPYDHEVLDLLTLLPQQGFGCPTLRFLLLIVSSTRTALTHLSRSRGTADDAAPSAAQRVETPA